MTEAFTPRGATIERAENGWIVIEYVREMGGGAIVGTRVHLTLDSALADMAEVVQAIERLRAMP